MKTTNHQTFAFTKCTWDLHSRSRQESIVLRVRSPLGPKKGKWEKGEIVLRFFLSGCRYKRVQTFCGSFGSWFLVKGLFWWFKGLFKEFVFGFEHFEVVLQGNCAELNLWDEPRTFWRWLKNNLADVLDWTLKYWSVDQCQEKITRSIKSLLLLSRPMSKIPAFFIFFPHVNVHAWRICLYSMGLPRASTQPWTPSTHIRSQPSRHTGKSACPSTSTTFRKGLMA